MGEPQARDHRHHTARDGSEGNWWAGHSHHNSWTTDPRHSLWAHTQGYRPAQTQTTTTTTATAPAPGLITLEALPPFPTTTTLPEQEGLTSTIRTGIEGTNVFTEIVPWWSTVHPSPVDTPATLFIVVVTSQSLVSTSVVPEVVSNHPIPTCNVVEVPPVALPSALHAGSSPMSGSPEPPPKTILYEPSEPPLLLPIASDFTPTETVLGLEVTFKPSPYSTLALYTSSLSSSPSKTTNPPTASGPHPGNASPGFSSSLSTNAKIGLTLGLMLFLLMILILSLLYLRHRKSAHSINQAYTSLLSPPTSPSSITISAQFWRSQSQHPRNDATPLIIDTGEGKTSLDSSGIRWPEKVVLCGEAAELWELGREYERERRNG